MQQELETARELAVRAGALLLDYYGRGVNVAWKSDGGPVTAADRAANDFLVSELGKRFPSDSILSEEQAAAADVISASRIWIIDPMDGTREFLSGNGEFSVMIGLAVEGVPVAGAVYQPTKDKLHSAARGAGATLTHHGSVYPLTVSTESNPAEMSVTLSRSHPSPEITALCARLGITRSVCSGSVGIKVGLICERAAHLYVHLGSRVSQWDTCAADILLREAGGRMTDKLGAPLRYGGSDPRLRNGVIASTGKIHGDIVRAAAQV